MKSRPSKTPSSAQIQSEVIRRELSQLVTHLQTQASRATDPKFKALVEKSTEVAEELRKLFSRFGDTSGSSSTREKESGSSKKEEERGTVSPTAAKAPTASKKEPSSGPDKARNEQPRPLGGSGAKSKPSSDKDKGPSAGESKPSSVAQSSPPGGTAAKPVDPDEVAARQRLQKKEARSPKMPGGPIAPKSIPPQSGKPVWARTVRTTR